ncbi:MAG: coproporphyrinogen dehydrogenase, partial [Candidatus Eremiobacteraeota bacterium]|nr:coproporphyrinogen dehydrogenase [Candidatus Eremiobacteraeota bacterium]
APGQTPVSLLASLHQAVSCGVDHISVYGLTIESATPYASWYARDPSAFPDEDAAAELLETAAGYLEHAGYAQYELSNFARPGFESAHNYGYWRQRDCVAFGLSAAGYHAGSRYRNVRDFDQYCDALGRGADARADAEHLGPAERIGEAAMLALRTAQGLRYDDFQRRFGVDATRIFARAINKCMAAGLLEGDAGGVRLSRRGRLLANPACAEFLVPEQMAVTQA